jgi:hypothetical protein
MDNSFIIFLILAPITMLFCGFAIARQLRPLEHTPLIAKFLQGKWLFIIITGLLISLLFTFLYSDPSGSSPSKIIAFLALFILTTASYYLGFKFGWGRPSSVDENGPIENPNQPNPLPENVVVENTITSIKITINSKKRWALFVLSIFPFAFVVLCAMPLLGLVVFSILQKNLPESMSIFILIILGVLALYLIYARFQDDLQLIFDKEVIEIDNQSITMENSGLGIKSRKEYPADNIKKITMMFSFGGTTGALKRSAFANTNMPVFLMWHNHGLKRYRSFGRAIDIADAQNILETIYSRFPQYKG